MNEVYRAYLLGYVAVANGTKIGAIGDEAEAAAYALGVYDGKGPGGPSTRKEVMGRMAIMLSRAES